MKRYEPSLAALAWLVAIYDQGGTASNSPSDPSVPTGVIGAGFYPAVRSLEAVGYAETTVPGQIRLTLEGRRMAETLRAMEDKLQHEHQFTDD
jgi:hypothetical protein